MSRSQQSMLGPKSSLVVTYRGADPHYHLRDPRQPNRPLCQPIRDAGVLMPRARAQDSGLIACSDCSPGSELANSMSTTEDGRP